MGLRDTKKERTRRRLVEIAYELFTEQGYDETTTSQIAANAPTHICVRTVIVTSGQ